MVLVSVQDQVAELIAAQIGEGDAASFDQALVDRMGELLEIHSEPDFECVMLGGPALGPTVRNVGSGVDGMRDVVGDWLDAFESLRAERIDVQTVGQSVVMDVVQIVTSHGVDVSTPSSIVFKFRGDRVAALEFHLDQDQARESALAGFTGN